MENFHWPTAPVSKHSSLKATTVSHGYELNFHIAMYWFMFPHQLLHLTEVVPPATFPGRHQGLLRSGHLTEDIC